MQRKSTHAMIAALIAVGIFYVACGEGEQPMRPPCISVSDCQAGDRCINNECIPPGVDAGPPRMDSGTAPGTDGGETDSGGPGPIDAATDAPMSGTL